MQQFFKLIQKQAAIAIPEGERVLVAVSGGGDSMMLLHALADGRQWRLVVGHFNHRLRGRASGADQRLVKRVAKQLDLKVVIGQWKQSTVVAHEHGLEMAAREARLGFLAQAARRHRCRFVATGHQADDQVETFFWRLLRGAGGLGLAGMHQASNFPGQPGLLLVRPLLAFSKAEILEHAQNIGIRYRDDESNRDMGPVRNRVRQNLLPILRDQFNSDMDSKVRQAMDLVGMDADCVKKFAAAWLEEGRGKFTRLHPAIQRWVMWLQLVECGVKPEYARIENLRLHCDKPLALDPSRILYRDERGRVHIREHTRLYFNPAKTRLKLSKRWGQRKFGDMRIRCCVGSSGIKALSENMEMLDADLVGDQAVLRHWQPGDRFQPVGMSSAVKLQDLFTNAKVSAFEKRRRVLASTIAGDIFWVEGLRIGEFARIRPETRRILCWQWRRL